MESVHDTFDPVGCEGQPARLTVVVGAICTGGCGREGQDGELVGLALSRRLSSCVFVCVCVCEIRGKRWLLLHIFSALFQAY